MHSGGHACIRCMNGLSEGMRRHSISPILKQSPARRWISFFPRSQLHHQRTSKYPRPPATTVKRHQQSGVKEWVQQEIPGVEQGSDLIFTHPTVKKPSGTVSRRDGQDLSVGAVLDKDDLFHALSSSPIPDMRRRAAIMKSHAHCPHPNHHRTRLPTSPHDPENRKSLDQATEPPAFVAFECPDCGIPTYCSEEHWTEDYESHSELCDTLREINEDDHDLRSGRFFPEFEYPWPPIEEAMPNMSNWDTYLYTREYNAINEMRSLRQVTRLLTYPITIASVIHELSPYNIRKEGRLTTEGLKSLTGRPNSFYARGVSLLDLC